jgi:hypothetical protein
MKRRLIFAYSLICYAAFFACFLYSIAFIADLGIVAKTIDSARAGPRGRAIMIDLALLSLFAVQHSGMARPGFKRVVARRLPEPAERATYLFGLRRGSEPSPIATPGQSRSRISSLHRTRDEFSASRRSKAKTLGWNSTR